MKAHLNTAAAVAFATVAAFGLAPGAASAQALQTANFLQACNGNQEILGGLVTPDEAGKAKQTSFCNCLLSQIGTVSQPDLDILTKDLEGTSTQEEHTAYATYQALSQQAGEALNSCVASEGLVPDADSGSTPEAPGNATTAPGNTTTTPGTTTPGNTTTTPDTTTNPAPAK